MTTPKLKPCPFCGKPAASEKRYDGTTVYVCTDGWCANDAEFKLEQWQHRPGEDAARRRGHLEALGRVEADVKTRIEGINANGGWVGSGAVKLTLVDLKLSVQRLRRRLARLRRSK